MIRYLLDTNAISELRKRHKHPGVHAFVSHAATSSLFASAMSIGELRKGIQLKMASDSVGAAILTAWAEEFESGFSDRILPVTADIAKLWGEWSADRSRTVVDTLIAATAAVHGMVLVTRNVRDVHDLPVQILNPWKS